MARSRNVTPSYIPHAKSGRGQLQWYDATGARREKLLPGPFGSPESLTAKAKLELELASGGVTATAVTATDPTSVAELMLAFLGHAERHYRRADGSPTHEVDEYKLVIRHVRALYGELPAAAFGPLALKAVRQRFIRCDWCRSLVNQRVGRVRRMFKWGVAEELVPAAVYQALAAVPGLQRGRSDARESAPVGPVDDAAVGATLPHLNAHLRAMVELQRLTGMRPGEARAAPRGPRPIRRDLGVPPGPAQDRAPG